MSKKLNSADRLQKVLSVGSSAQLLLQVQKFLPTAVIEALLEWTGGEPKLTQALFQLVVESYKKQDNLSDSMILVDEQIDWLEELIRTEAIGNWETTKELELVRKIRDRLLNNKNCEPFWLLKVYKQILKQRELTYDESPEQEELLSIGLLVEDKGKLKVCSRIYKSIFTRGWIDKQLTGLRPYELTLQKLEEKANSPYTVLEQILSWTNRNFFLTQKICHLVSESPEFIASGKEADKITDIVENFLFNDWENGVAGTHLKEIRDRLLQKKQGVPRLLKQYQQVLQYPELPVNYNSREQQELLQLGLLDVHQGNLVIYNRIYEKVFNVTWVKEQLAQQSNSSVSDPSARKTSSTKKNTAKFPQQQPFPPVIPKKSPPQQQPIPSINIAENPSQQQPIIPVTVPESPPQQQKMPPLTPNTVENNLDLDRAESISPSTSKSQDRRSASKLSIYGGIVALVLLIALAVSEGIKTVINNRDRTPYNPETSNPESRETSEF